MHVIQGFMSPRNLSTLVQLYRMGVGESQIPRSFVVRFSQFLSDCWNEPFMYKTITRATEVSFP